MKSLHLLLSAIGLSGSIFRVQYESKVPAPAITIQRDPMPETLEEAVFGAPYRGHWHSAFDRAENRKGRKFRSQRERSRRRHAAK